MGKLSKVLGAGLAIVLSISMAAPSFADVNNEKDKLSDLNAQKNKAARQKNELEASKSDAEAYISQVDKQLTKLATDIYETNQKLDKTKDKIDKTNKKLKSAQESITVQYSDMKLRIQYMYENGDTQMLDLILNSESITEFLNKAEYITELSQYDRKMLHKLKETKQAIADAKETLVTEKENLVTMQKKQKNDKAQLEQLSDSKKKELSTYVALLEDNEANSAALDAEISAQEQKVAAAEQQSIDAAKQEAARKAAQEAQNAANNNNNNNNNNQNNGGSHSGNGSFGWPCPGYTSVSSGYGYRSDPFSGSSSFHNGIDIPAPAGTPVVAASSGTVEWANLNPTAGNWIGINHGNGVYTIYMHMSALLVSPGTQVSAGQTIGLVGTTGSSTGNHLHFTVRVNGAYQNPYDYLN